MKMMSRSKGTILCLSMIALPLVACGEDAPAQNQAVVLHPLMKEIVAPQAQVLWDISAKAMNDQGDPDGTAMTAADWDAIGKAASALDEASKKLAVAKVINVVEPGQKIQDEDVNGSPTAAKVQGYVDADKAVFAAMSEAMANNAQGFIEAAKNRDAVKLSEVSGELDAVCETCHKQFWYPQQAALPQ